MNQILEEIGKIGIVPVIKIDDAQKAVPLSSALIDGGIPCIELTFRTAAAEEAIRLVSKALPQMLIGAGTILTTEQVDKAVAAGAKFIVSPGFNEKIVSYCIGKGIPITPGCSNPSDIERAIEAGLDVVKFFPAEQAGGLDYIKAVSAPYPNLKFMPTGGINAGNIVKYISFDKILACGGSWMANEALINSGDFQKIAELSREAIFSLLGFHIAHIGINAGGEANAKNAAFLFNALFGFTAKEGNSSIFAGSSIEIMKDKAVGKNGHIAIGTNSIPRAIYYLQKHGTEFDFENAKKDAKGETFAIFFKEEILGFAVHLLKKA